MYFLTQLSGVSIFTTAVVGAFYRGLRSDTARRGLRVVAHEDPLAHRRGLVLLLGVVLIRPAGDRRRARGHVAVHGRAVQHVEFRGDHLLRLRGARAHVRVGGERARGVCVGVTRGARGGAEPGTASYHARRGLVASVYFPRPPRWSARPPGKEGDFFRVFSVFSLLFSCFHTPPPPRCQNNDSTNENNPTKTTTTTTTTTTTQPYTPNPTPMPSRPKGWGIFTFSNL